jgi:predicted RNase H-like HicB family nuclease
MRKLLIMFNAMIDIGRPWNPEVGGSCVGSTLPFRRTRRRGHYCGRHRSGLRPGTVAALPCRAQPGIKDLAASQNSTTVDAVAKSQKFFVTPEQDEEGWFVAKCPGLPGCVSQGTIREEAIANIREAIEGSLERRAANSIPSNIETIEIEIIVA